MANSTKHSISSPRRLAICSRRPNRCMPKKVFRPKARPLATGVERPALTPIQSREAALTTSKTPLLDRISTPDELRKLPPTQLHRLAEELRRETIEAVSVTGGHLGAGLGVVELTVALHYVFDTPRDRIIWDVGHQTYPPKILPAAATAYARCARAAGSPVSPSASRANTTPSAPVIPRPRYRRASEWPSPAISLAATITSSR